MKIWYSKKINFLLKFYSHLLFYSHNKIIYLSIGLYIIFERLKHKISDFLYLLSFVFINIMTNYYKKVISNY